MKKEITSKKKKTEADEEELSRLDFFGGLYMAKDGPVIPAENIAAMLIRAAKSERMGKDAGAGIMVNQHARLEYEGPRTAQELWDTDGFVHTAMVNISGRKRLRTRPIFENWEIIAIIEYEDTSVNEADLDRWINDAGTKIGFGDWRPEKYGRFGRFAVEVLDASDAVPSINGREVEKVSI